MQRAEGTGRFSVKKTESRSALEILHESGAAKLRFPRQVRGADTLEAIVINTAGGMTGGDRFNWEIAAGPGTDVSITTQANEKVYKASSGAADVSISLRLERDSRVAWLPQETILFQHAALTRKLDVEMAPGSELLLCEAIVFGRHGHGEKFTQGLLRDRWRVRAGDTLVHAEELYLEGDAGLALGRAAVAGGAGAVATLIAIGGKSLFAASAEMRYRVNASIGLAAFVDAGNAFDTYYPEFDKLKLGVGAGVRYLTPVGPLRVDLAFPLEPNKDDSWVALYVGLGQSF